MSTLLEVAAFNAAYVRAIDSDALEQWPDFFTPDAHYRITNIENEQEGLVLGAIWANCRAMLQDRVSALREANIYERQRYRHILGLPTVLADDSTKIEAETPFVVVRIMHTGQSDLFASGAYRDCLVRSGDGQLAIEQRIVICDSVQFDTLLALPL